LAAPTIQANLQIAKTNALTRVYRWGVELKFLWLEQILEVQAHWKWYVFLSIALPLIMVFGFTRIGGGTNQIYAITGTVVFAIADEALSAMAVRVGTMRREGLLAYYAALPIHKTSFVVALVLSRMMITLPRTLVAIIAGPLLFGIAVQFNPLIVVVLILSSLMLATLGVALGLMLESPELLRTLTYVMLFVVVMASPVFMPLSLLPVPLQYTSYLLPFSYIADALRDIAFGMTGFGFGIDMLVLGAMTAVSFALLERYLRWRLD